MNQPLRTLLLGIALAAAPGGRLGAQLPQAGLPYDCVTVRSSGSGGITNISAFAPIMPLRPTAFTAADFTAACSGAAAFEVTPAPSWCPSLTADPLARWIATSPFRTAVSALYCQSFQLPSCGVQQASIRFSFCVDDQLGDPAADPNPIGVYLNGQPIAGFAGLGSQVTWTSTTIAPLLVAGQNQLQVYVRDTGASVAGVLYSATICYVACRGDEIVQLRSGNGPFGGADSAISVLAGAPVTALPINAANFAAAGNGPAATVVPPTPFWCPSLSADAQARWISTNNSYGPGSALYSHPFAIGSCNVLSASLTFWCNVSDWLGDPAGTPNVGLYLNQNAIPLSVVDGQGGGTCDHLLTASIPGAWLNGNATNTLAVYVRDTSGGGNGIVYSATLRVRPCPPRTEIIALRSGNGTLGGNDGQVRCFAGSGGSQPLSALPFAAGDFAAAATGPAANIVQNFLWCPSLTQDPLAQWVSSATIPGPVRSAMYAQPFTVATCAGNLQQAQLVVHYCADDGLGDPSGGGPNPLGIYLNGQPVPGTAGDISTWPGSNQKTITVANVAPMLQSGGNWLYVYVRDRNNGISGVMYSATITISPCATRYYGDPCGVTVPNTFLQVPPSPGGAIDYRLRGDSIAAPQPLIGVWLIGVSDAIGPSGLPLPLDLTPVGGTGCQILNSMDVLLAFLVDPAGNADLFQSIPNAPVFYDLPIFLQTFVLDGVSNPLGLSATRGIAVDIRL